MPITFNKYIDNPLGGNVLPGRAYIKQFYTDKFNAILLREQGTIKYTLYKDDDGHDSHYVHIKIPSEVVPAFYYDVVVRFYAGDNSVKNDASLRHYFVQFFSNDPNFVYTFAHSFSKSKMFIDDLAPKMMKEALEKKAITRNPKDTVSYVKSLYFAYLALERYNLFSKAIYTTQGKKYKKKELLNKITSASSMIAKRNEEGERIAKEKRKAEEAEAKRKQKETKKNQVKQSTKSGITKTAKVSTTAKNTKTTKVIGKK